jgi:aarF domain-containing kinase
MQTDPNWSNFLNPMNSDKIVLIDFGSSRDFSSSFIQDYYMVISAAAAGDRSAVAEWSRKLGFITGEETKAMIEAHEEAVLALALPFSQPGPYDFAMASEQVTNRIRGLIPTMVNYRLTPPPDESYSLHRKLSGVFLLCTKLRAKVDCHSLLQSHKV